MRNLNDVLENLTLSRWAGLLERHPDQLGALHETDAELLPLDDERVLAFTIDAVAEEVQTGLYRDPYTVGRIATLASVSDLSAVGAAPLGLLVAVTLPADDFEAAQHAVGAGIRDAANQCGMFVLGGDTNQGPSLEVTVAAAGIVPRDEIVTRIGTRIGDEIFVSGPVGLGGALAACSLLGLGTMTEADFAPVPRIREGQVARGFATACMDTSDGLIATLDQLSRLNAARFVVDVDFMEILHPLAARVAADSGIGAFPFAASYHGEFELVFTVAPEDIPAFRAAATEIGWEPIRIGLVAEGMGVADVEGDIDGALIRNLLDEVSGDVGEYARRLMMRGRDGS